MPTLQNNKILYQYQKKYIEKKFYQKECGMDVNLVSFSSFSEKYIKLENNKTAIERNIPTNPISPLLCCRV